MDKELSGATLTVFAHTCIKVELHGGITMSGPCGTIIVDQTDIEEDTLAAIPGMDTKTARFVKEILEPGYTLAIIICSPTVLVCVQSGWEDDEKSYRLKQFAGVIQSAASNLMGFSVTVVDEPGE